MHNHASNNHALYIACHRPEQSKDGIGSMQNNSTFSSYVYRFDGQIYQKAVRTSNFFCHYQHFAFLQKHSGLLFFPVVCYGRLIGFAVAGKHSVISAPALQQCHSTKKHCGQ